MLYDHDPKEDRGEMPERTDHAGIHRRSASQLARSNAFDRRLQGADVAIHENCALVMSNSGIKTSSASSVHDHMACRIGQ